MDKLLTELRSLIRDKLEEASRLQIHLREMNASEEVLEVKKDEIKNWQGKR